VEGAVQAFSGVLLPDEYDCCLCVRIEADISAEAVFDSGRGASDGLAGDLGGGGSFCRYAEAALGGGLCGAKAEQAVCSGIGCYIYLFRLYLRDADTGGACRAFQRGRLIVLKAVISVCGICLVM